MSPSPFVVEWLRRLGNERSGARALDVAMGRGRHTQAIVDAGFQAFGVDRNLDAIRDATITAARRGHHLRAWCADLATYPLPERSFDVVLVARYLQRDLFTSLVRCLRPSGAIVYETFTTAQRAHGVGPTSPDHLLAPGELRRLLGALECVFYEEVSEPEAVARFVGRQAARRA